MGQGLYSKCSNSSGNTFNGTNTDSQCMYDLDNLNSLPTGSSSAYIEEKNSGGCFFKSSYFITGYALPGTPQGLYNIAIGFSSQGGLSLDAPWVQQSIVGDIGIAYIWTLPSGVDAILQGVVPSGNQYNINWTLPSDEDVSQKSGVTAQLGKLAVPNDGEDYQGPPKETN